MIRGRLRTRVVPVFGPSDVDRVRRFYSYCLRLLSSVVKALVTDPGVSGGALVLERREPAPIVRGCVDVDVDAVLAFAQWSTWTERCLCCM